MRAKRLAPRPDGPLTHFASPLGEKCRLVRAGESQILNGACRRGDFQGFSRDRSVCIDERDTSPDGWEQGVAETAAPSPHFSPPDGRSTREKAVIRVS